MQAAWHVAGALPPWWVMVGELKGHGTIIFNMGSVRINIWLNFYFIGVLTLSDDMWFEQEFCDGVNHGKSTNHF